MEDVTIRVQREKEKDLLLGELRHRMKNLLALVQSLARQTAVEGRSGKEYRDAFLGRFQALAQAHDLAFTEQGGAQLSDLVQRTLKPYSTDQMAVVVIPGPAVTLKSAQVTPVNMILHELATNAVKHGALSMPGGQVRVSWELEEGDAKRLHLRWQEQGGPEVRPPTVRGFGVRLVEFAATRELEGRAELTFAPEGLVAEIILPLV
jgi:two-component sensor histidine kinase